MVVLNSMDSVSFKLATVFLALLDNIPAICGAIYFINVFCLRPCLNQGIAFPYYNFFFRVNSAIMLVRANKGDYLCLLLKKKYCWDLLLNSAIKEKN